MIYLWYGLLIGLAVLAVGYVTVKALDSSLGWASKRWIVVAVFAWAAVIGAGLYLAELASNKGPCLEWRTSMYWNSATKSMMPARTCAARAEWVKE